MRIRWENLVPLFLLIMIVILIVKSQLFELFSQSIENLRYRQDDPMYGLACLGIICITIIGIFKIISNRKR